MWNVASGSSMWLRGASQVSISIFMPQYLYSCLNIYIYTSCLYLYLCLYMYMYMSMSISVSISVIISRSISTSVSVYFYIYILRVLIQEWDVSINIALSHYTYRCI